MKRILLTLALLGAVAQTQATRFTPEEETLMLAAFPESTYNFVLRQVSLWFEAASNVVSREAKVAANEPVIKAVIDASNMVYATGSEIVGNSAEMLKSAKDFAPQLPGATLEVAKNNKYTLAIVAIAAGSFGVYKLCTMKPSKNKNASF